jgi:hypothetical protein
VHHSFIVQLVHIPARTILSRQGRETSQRAKPVKLDHPVRQVHQQCSHVLLGLILLPMHLDAVLAKLVIIAVQLAPTRALWLVKFVVPAYTALQAPT